GGEDAPNEAIEPPGEGVAVEEVRLQLPVDPERGTEGAEMLVVRLDFFPPELDVAGEAETGRGRVNEVAVVDEIEGRGQCGNVKRGEQQAAEGNPPREARGSIHAGLVPRRRESREVQVRRFWTFAPLL